MKNFIFNVLILFVVTLNFSILAQTENISGDYELKVEATDGLIISKLTLNTDGSFFFHEYNDLKQRLIQESNKYAKGTWKANKKIISFFANPSDLDEKYTLNFDASKARFISKSPRDISAREIKTSLQFYDAEIFWITGRTFYKIE